MKRKLTTLSASLLLACVMLVQPFVMVFAAEGAGTVPAQPTQEQSGASAPSGDKTAAENGAPTIPPDALPDPKKESSTPAAPDGATTTQESSNSTSPEKTEGLPSPTNPQKPDASPAADANTTGSAATSDVQAEPDTTAPKPDTAPEGQDGTPAKPSAINPLAAEPEITTDLVIDVTQLSQETPSITGTYDTGGNPGDYVPGKDFSKTDDVSTGKVVDYSIGVSLSSKSSSTYPIDKMYLEVVDPASASLLDHIKVYNINTDPNPQNITDDGSDVVIPNVSMKLTGLVFDQTAGITSNSTQKMPVTITVPATILWKSKVMPQIRIVCERGSLVEKSEPFTLQTARFSSAAVLASELDSFLNEWNAFAYETTPAGTGFLLPFRMWTSQVPPTTITPLGTIAAYDTITYSVKIGATLDGVAQALTADSFDLSALPAIFYTLVSKTYAGGILTVVVKPVPNAATLSFPPMTVAGKVFVPYTKGAAQSVTLALNGSWNNAVGGNGVLMTNFVNEYLFAETVAGSIARTRTISFVVKPIPVFVVENIQASFSPPNIIYHSLRISPNTFTNNKDIKFVRIMDSKNASLPKATGMKLTLQEGTSYTQIYSQPIAPSLYTFQYAYAPITPTFDPNALSQQVINGTVPLDTYENVVTNTGNKPNIMLCTLSGDATQGLPITDQITQLYDIVGPGVVTMPGSDFYSVYTTNPSANYTTYLHSYIALATNYANTTLANAAYGSAIASIDKFVQRGNTVYLDLGTNKAPSGYNVQRFGMSSNVRADLPLPTYNAIMISGLYSALNSPIADINDYSKEYLYQIYRRISPPAGNGDANFKAGNVVTIPVDPAIAPYLYLGNAPYLHVIDPATLTWTDVPITTYSYDGSTIKLTMPVDYVMNSSSPLVVPVRFIVPYANIPSTTKTPTTSQPLQLATYQGASVVETFPTTTPYFSATFENTPYRLMGGNVDTTGLLVAPQEYLGGTAPYQ